MLVPPDSMRKLLEDRLVNYRQQFHESDSAGSTYWGNRGLTITTAAEFQIGFVKRPIRGDQRFRNSIAVPYLTPSGIVSMKFRTIKDDTEYRFAKDSGDPNRIFNTGALMQTQPVWVSEGEFDAMALAQCGLPALAIPGATQWKDEWARVFRGRDVTVVCDGDEAGRQFGEKLTSRIYGAKIIEMPDDEDVCSMLVSKGEDWIKGAVA